MFLTVKEMLMWLLHKNGEDTTKMRVREIVEKGTPLFFDFDYPLYNKETNKKTFEKLFIQHFLDRKLCFPVDEYDDWNFEFDGALNLIMPYYNQLLESETWFDKYITNPSANTDYKETYTKKYESERKGKSTSNSNISSESKSEDESNGKDSSNGNGKTNTKSNSKNSSNSHNVSHSEAGTKNNSATNDLPKSPLNFGESDLNTLQYASALEVGSGTSTSDGNSDQSSSGSSDDTAESITETESSSKSTMQSNGQTKGSSVSESESNDKTSDEGTEEYEFHRVGNIGVQTPGEVFTNTRKAFINATKMIFEDEEIENLFLHIY